MVGMLAAASPGLAHDLSIGLTLHHNMTCLKGSFTGVRGEPFDLFGDAGKSFECGAGPPADRRGRQRALRRYEAAFRTSSAMRSTVARGSSG